MICFKCGKMIPDGSASCLECGADLTRPDETGNQDEKQLSKNSFIVPFILVMIAAVISFVFMALDYMTVDVTALAFSSSRSFKGYSFLGALAGTGRITGIMIILLILVNIATIITSVLGMLGKIKTEKLNNYMLYEVIVYVVVTVIPIFHVSTLLHSFDDTIGVAKMGPGVFLNVGVAAFMSIMYFLTIRKKLSK
ncbi:MAG: zinc ribbon domain-containing protein [Lachnospiraceae bacterium]|nr:zinc ribbon domain-containing protein [Lachnospiraceae bacterium]